MNIDITGIFCITLYKLASLATGLASLTMGYRLFLHGIWGRPGEKTELETIFGNNKIVMKSGAPGTFFALFGTVVIAISIFKGFTITPSHLEDPDLSSYIDVIDTQNQTSQNKDHKKEKQFDNSANAEKSAVDKKETLVIKTPPKKDPKSKKGVGRIIRGLEVK